MNSHRIAIIGGGIAGLAFAIRYRQLGGRADVFERGELPGRDGLGFIVLENGMAAIRALGFDKAVTGAGYPLNTCQVFDTRGVLQREEELSDSFGHTRKAFVEMLLAAIPSDWIHVNHRFSHFEFDAAGRATTARFDNGESVAADLFLGCDGTRSKVRQQIFPNASHAPVRVREIVSTVRAPHWVARLHHRFRKFVHPDGGLALGLVPAGDETLIWYLQFDAQRYPMHDESVAGKRDFVRALTADWPEPCSWLVEATDFSHSHLCNTCYLHPLPSFHRGNIALLGDAAHAMLTFTSQGVCAALNDAVQLADSLATASAGAAYLALEHWSVRRKAAVKRLLAEGIELQNQFLMPVAGSQPIPLVLDR